MLNRLGSILSISIVAILSKSAHGYDQADEVSYLENFQSLTAQSHSILNDTNVPPSLVTNCVDQGKLSAPLVDVTVAASTTSTQVQAICGPNDHCIIPQGVKLVMDSDLNVGALTLLDGGELEWKDSTEGGATSYYLCAGYIISSGSASTFHLDLSSQGDSTGIIYIKNNGAKPSSVDMMGERVLGTYGGGNMIVKGREKRRTWTLLSETLAVGESSMKVIHDVVSMGWRVGDRIGVAPTEHGSSGKASAFIISAITDSYTIELSHPNNNDKAYGASFINGQSSSPPVLKAAEVVNLSRNVVITGDDFEHIDCDPSVASNTETSSMGCKCSATRSQCTIGLHTIHHSHPSPSPGTMHISNTKVEKCGQRGIEGKYCLHFHKSGDCPECVFENNAVEFGHHRGITVHGTHRSTVTNNVVWDVRGANFYIEDGNEMHNELSFNVAICPYSLSDPIMQGCSIPGTSSPGADAPNAAFYSRAATNDWLGNRAANTYNGMLLDAGTRGAATGKVCYADAALGRWVGNVMHGCSRFGLYTLGHGGNFPKHTDRSIATNGFNQNFDLCTGFDVSESINPGTTDRGYPGAFYQNVDYHNVFVGHYMAGDLQHHAHSSINNNNLIYWKETKNMADGCASHFYDSFYQDGNMALPDQGTIIISKTKMKNVHLEANHHCDVGSTGLLCMPTYLLDETIWEGSSSNKWVTFQAGYNNDGGIFSLAPGQDENGNGGFFPQGFRSLAGGTYSYLLASPGPRQCIDSTKMYGNRYDNGILCKADLRSFKIYSRGLTESTALALKVEVWFNSLGLGGQNGPANAMQLVGFHIIGGAESTSVKQGYSFPIMTGLTQSYKISLYDEAAGTTHNIPTDWVIEFSDPVVGRFGNDDEIYVNVVGRSCGTNGNGLITSLHDRKLLWSGDNFIDNTAWGLHGACTESPDMFRNDCGSSEVGSIPPSECPELCAFSPCNANSYCHCGMSATCKCKPGYTGSDCSFSVCASAGCGEHGSCIATHLGGEGDVSIDLSVACVCEEGWYGATCEFNPCQVGATAKTCSGNGKCLSQNGVDTECQCEPGFLGNDCERLNLAHGKTSSSSSELQPAARAFDGEMSSRWESVHGVNDVVLDIDLGDFFHVDEVTIHWETSAAARYDIELSNDGVTFASAWSKTDGYANMGTVTSSLNGGIARYVRMHAFERAINYGYSIFEMQVFGSQGPSSAPTPYPTYEIITLSPTVSSIPTSLPPTSSPTIINVLISQDKSSSASSENGAGSVASKAFDGDMASRWESIHGIEDVWLEVDLGDMFVISKVFIDWEFAAAKIYDIEVSNDGVSFTSVWTKNDGFGGIGSVESVIGSSVTGRFVRMHAFERATAWGYSIFEMKVYGFSPCGGCGDHGTCVRTSETEYECKCDTDWSGNSCETTCAGYCLGVYPYGCNPNLGPEIVKYGCLSNGGCSYLTAGNEFSANVCTFREVVNEYTTLTPTAAPTPDPTPAPSSNPTSLPTPDPTTTAPTPDPTPAPSSNPTSLPTPDPTTAAPTPDPTPVPSSNPTSLPTPDPTTAAPTPDPTPAPSSNPTSLPTPDPTTAAPFPTPTPNPTLPLTPAPIESVDKYVCSKNEPLPATICAEGSLAGGECSSSGSNSSCGKGGKSCWWASCSGSGEGPPTPTPPTPTYPPTSAPPTDGCPVCAPTGQECCGSCVDGGKPSYRGCFL